MRSCQGGSCSAGGRASARRSRRAAAPPGIDPLLPALVHRELVDVVERDLADPPSRRVVRPERRPDLRSRRSSARSRSPAATASSTGAPRPPPSPPPPRAPRNRRPRRRHHERGDAVGMLQGEVDRDRPPIEHPTMTFAVAPRASSTASRSRTCEYGSPVRAAGTSVSPDVVADHAERALDQPGPAGPTSASPRARGGASVTRDPRQPPRSTGNHPEHRPTRCARPPSLEARPALQSDVRLREQLGQHACLPHDGHEVRVTAPSRDHVPVEVAGIPAPATRPRFIPMLNPAGRRPPERGERALQQSLELARSPRP